MSDAQRYADYRNSQMFRDDVEWAVDPTGRLYLRDKFSWSANRARELEAKAERDRVAWKRAQRQGGKM